MTVPVRGLVEMRRAVAMPELGAGRSYVALQRPGFRVYVAEARGLVVDSRLLGASGGHLLTLPPAIGHITIPLEGSFIARRGRELEVEPRSALIDTSRELSERWEGPRFAALCVEWDARFGAPASMGELRLSSEELVRMRGIARSIVAGSLSESEFDALLSTLVANGVLDPAGFVLFDEVPPARAHELARALNHLFTNFAAHPDSSDLEERLDLSARHIRRTLHGLGPWSPLPGGSIRAALRRNRAWLAPSLATAHGATVERVAVALGYRSPTALRLALRQEGVPAPSEARAIAYARSA